MSTTEGSIGSGGGLGGGAVPDVMPPLYTMKFERFTGITASTDATGAVWLHFPTISAVHCLVLEAMGALTALRLINGRTAQQLHLLLHERIRPDDRPAMP